jgi:hypothetical protein
MRRLYKYAVIGSRKRTDYGVFLLCTGANMHELEKDIETLVLATLEERDILADYRQDNRSAMQALVHLVDKGLVETYCREGRTHFRLTVGMPE